jgi:hypothetical protein
MRLAQSPLLWGSEGFSKDFKESSESKGAHPSHSQKARTGQSQKCPPPRGTEGSNPSPSSRESVSPRSLSSWVKNPGFPRGCARLRSRCGRQRAAGPAHIAPTRSNISVGPYSSTAFPAMRSRQVVGLKSQLGAQTRSGFLGAQGCWWILRGRTGLKQSRARSADRASLVADVSARAASAPSDRAVGAHRESLG